MKINEYYIVPSCSINQLKNINMICASDFRKSNAFEDADIANEYEW